MLHVKDSAFWTLHPYACDGITFRNLNITADERHGHNTDGIDPDSSRNVLVENCSVKVGDDAVAIKSGIDFFGRQFGRPSENMLFRSNHFRNGHVALGSEESGGIHNITFLNNILGEEGITSSAGLDLKAERGRGGHIRNITFDGLHVLGFVKRPITIHMHYSDDRKPTNASATPAFSDITIQNVVVETAQDVTGWAGSIVGLPESKIERLSLRNVTAKLASGSSSHEGWQCEYVSGSAQGVEPSMQTSCLDTSVGFSTYV